MKFDTFLSSINSWGHYQRIKFIFICLTYMVAPIMVYTWSFTAATPDFRCYDPSKTDDTYDEQSNKIFNKFYQPTKDECALHHQLISVKECQRCYRKSRLDNSSLQACDAYVFDRSIYKTTLVEEV